MSQAKSEWDLDSATGQITRKLRGAELMVRASELTNNGNFQLNLLGEFETSIPKDELRKRCQTAWWLTRQTLPLIGVTLGLEQAFFKPIQSVDDAKLWISETCIFENNVTCEEVLLKQCRQASDVTKLTVILEPWSGRLGCVLNISHTLTSLDSYQIIDSFVSNLSARECDVDLEQNFSPETATLATRLPQSLGQAYANQHPAMTEAEREKAWRIYEYAQERWERSSIGIPVHPDHGTRASLIHNEQVIFTAAEVKAAFAAAKMQGVTITAMFFACIAAGIKARYSDGSEDGAHLVFSGNGQRWLDIRASDSQAPVGMSILPGALWLDQADMSTGEIKPRDILDMARKIQALQNQDLVSKHIIAVYDELAPTAFQAAMESRHHPRAVPRVCRPTLTSQGEFAKHGSAAQVSNDAGARKAKLLHFRTGGRNTDSSVCFALYSFRGDMRCNTLFDEKFFDRDEVVGLMDTIMVLFRRVAFSVQHGTLAKL
ncbi:hypothetical protein BBO_02479 [Beauveria brongniartii RCEF 3172]|uniref:Condensation domain protein n=1 Tax=Beauveria brongniartii RCEF 3172 TaxID=1081107 RepID=A0A162M0L8_9HYPO|nr:hypothetical protein BBO_02479 [Beauveria brongniartii RCEF 3172]